MLKYQNDEALLYEDCLLKKPKAQNYLYHKYADKMFGICFKYTNDKHLAEDVLQDGFSRVFKNLDKFDNKGSFEAWIVTIMKNTAIDFYRRKWKNAYTNIDDLLFDVKNRSESLELLEKKDLMRIIDDLPKGFKTVFTMFAIDGYKHKEIAEQLNITESTSKSQMNRCRTHLQEKLKLDYKNRIKK